MKIKNIYNINKNKNNNNKNNSSCCNSSSSSSIKSSCDCNSNDNNNKHARPKLFESGKHVWPIFLGLIIISYPWVFAMGA